MNVAPPGPEEVHVWYVSLRRMALHITQFARTLSDEELQRAECFHFDRDRSRFVLARGILRMILGAYNSCPPAGLSFSYGPYGKPMVEEIPFNFNLSHSDDTAMYAISQRLRIGIDVELVRPLAEMDSIAERVLTRRETDALATIGPDEKAAQFFQLWTRKESVLKGLGLGLGVSPQAIEVLHDVVQLVPAEDPSGLLRGEPASWRVHNLLVNSEYKAAVAIDGDITRILCREWGVDQPV
jgi:4'-phosphopantetheinyl transferase